jgi:hypothetical protein
VADAAREFLVTSSPVELALLAVLGAVTGGLGVMLGAGGGFLLAPLLLLLFHLPPPVAAGTVSLVVCLNALAGTLAHTRQGTVSLPVGSWLSVFAAPGALLGTQAVQGTPPAAFRALLGTLLLGLSAVLMLRPPQQPHTARQTPPPHPAALASVGFGVGFVGGYFGLGAGWLVTPFLTYVAGLPVHRAVGTSLLVVFTASLTAVATHAFEGTVLWQAGLAAGLGAFLAAPGAARLALALRESRLVWLLSTAATAVGLRLLLW